MIRRIALACALAGVLAAADAVDRRLEQAGDTGFLAADLSRAVQALPEGERPGALARIASKRLPETSEVLRPFLDDRDPLVVAAAIRALATAWPTTMVDAVAVRERLASGQAGVVEAACAFVARVGDDRAVPALIALLDGSGREAATRALLAITGQGFASPGDWQGWWQERERAVAGMIAGLRAAIESGDPRRIEDAIMPLLGERRGASAIAELLSEAAGYPDPAVAEAAAAGLATCPGPVAACWRSSQPAAAERQEPAPSPPAVLASASQPLPSAPAAGGSGWVALLVVAALGFGLWRFARPGRAPAPVAAPPDAGETRKKPRISVTFSK